MSITNKFIKAGGSLPIVAFFLLVSFLSGCGTRAETPGERINSTPASVATASPAKKPETKPDAEALSRAQTVTYCDLVKDPAKYDRQIVRIRALYFTAFEKTYLYDSACGLNQPPSAPKEFPPETWAQWDRSLITQGDSDEAKLNRQLNGFGTKDVTVIGRFNSTDEQGAGGPNRFGHMGSSRYQFLIMRAEKVVDLKDR
jgi:hypothetical protein